MCVSLCVMFVHVLAAALTPAQKAFWCRNTEWLISLANACGMRMPGVEPGSQAWEACMIPLHYMRFCST